VAAAAVGVVAVALASGLAQGTSTGGPGARFLPVLLGGLMVLLGLAVALGRAPAAAPVADPADTGPGGGGRALATVGVMGAYTLVLERVGFLLATVALVAVLVRMYGERRWAVALAVAVGAAGAAYGLFAAWLRVPLPAGIFAP
jgi:putative tricarboxylic transport membrane protein